MTFSSIYLDKKWYNGKNTELGLRRPKADIRYFIVSLTVSDNLEDYLSISRG